MSVHLKGDCFFCVRKGSRGSVEAAASRPSGTSPQHQDSREQLRNTNRVLDFFGSACECDVTISSYIDYILRVVHTTPQ